MGTKIYCFGGEVQDKNSDNSMIVLDIFSGTSNTADDFQSQWATVTTNTNGLEIKGRNHPSFAQLQDEKTMLISGGWTAGNIKLTSQTLAFNGDTKTWEGFEEYIEAPYGIRQMLVNTR